MDKKLRIKELQQIIDAATEEMEALNPFYKLKLMSNKSSERNGANLISVLNVQIWKRQMRQGMICIVNRLDLSK
jgi:hypothetical protein